METPLIFNIFYTQDLRGDLHRFPYLYTFLQTLREHYVVYSPDDPETYPDLLLDLGGACTDSAWHCQVTGGRSALVVLDGMGYHALNIDGALTAIDRAKIAPHIQAALVDANNDWHYEIPPITDSSIRVGINNASDNYRCQIQLQAQAATQVVGNTLQLGYVPSFSVGVVQLYIEDNVKIAFHLTEEMPADLHPNPSIVAAVEFVEGEARYYQSQHPHPPRSNGH